MNRRIVLMLCGAALLLPAASAGAQTPSQGGYGSTPIPLPNVGHSGTHGTGTSGAAGAATKTNTVASPSARRLPFTGVDARLIALGGVMLLAMGFALRRGTRPRTD